MSYQYPVTTFKPVDGPESFEFLISYSPGEAIDILFMGTFDPTFHVVTKEMDGKEVPLPAWERPEFNPYRIMVSTRKGLNQLQIEDDIIFRIDGIY